MRRSTFLFGVLMLVAMGVDAGVGTQFPRYLATLHYENSSGERGVSFFETDENGLPTRGIWMLEDGSRSSINRYSSKGDYVVGATRWFSDGKESTETVELENGKLSVEHFERTDGVKGYARYEYDDGGSVRAIVCDRAKGWFTGRIVPIYGDEGRWTRAEITRDGETIGRIEYSYAADGLLQEELWTLGDWTQTFRFEYHDCDADQKTRRVSLNAFVMTSAVRRMKKETYDFSGESGGPSSFEYDDAGRLVKKTFTRSDGVTTYTDYLYDCSGVVTHAYRRYSSEKAAVFTYIFDENGVISRKSWVASDGARGSETYVRDGRGVPVRARYEAMDGWLTGDLVFVAEENGRLLSGQYMGDDGMNADLAFRYDERGELHEIHWILPSGRSQTYTFEYEDSP